MGLIHLEKRVSRGRPRGKSLRCCWGGWGRSASGEARASSGRTVQRVVGALRLGHRASARDQMPSPQLLAF